jgi:hypothetical protein
MTSEQENEISRIKEKLDETQKSVFDTTFYFKFLKKGRSFNDAVNSAKSAVFDIHPLAEACNRDRARARRVEFG